MRRIITALLLLAVMLFSGCSIGGKVCIDWVDFIQFNDITYENIYDDAALDSESIDKEYARVRYKVADNVSNPRYKTKNGDAAFMDEGTVIYTIKGYSPNFRLAAYRNGKIAVYEAYRNPKAKKGNDILDIKGKVKYISINSETDGKTEIARIVDSELVSKLVDMVLAAEISEGEAGDGQRYFICFQLDDGSKVNRAYWINSGEMSYDIQLPKEFGEEISKALEAVNNETAPDEQVEEPEDEKVEVPDNDTETIKEFYYVIPGSDKFLLTKEQLMFWDRDFLSLARNEIYARHGYIFKDKDLEMYFNKISWYKPDPTYNGDLSEVERKNIELIRNVESTKLKPDEKWIAQSSGGKLSYDLNGDGEKEDISYTMKTNEFGIDDSYSLSVNGKQTGDYIENGVSEFTIVDIDPKDNYKEIAIEEYGPSDDLRTTFYFYDGNDIRYMGKISGLCGNKEYVSGDGKVKANTRFQILMTWFFYDEYKLTEDHSLMHIDKDLYYTTTTCILKAEMKVPVYSSTSENKTAFNLQPGDEVILLGSDGKKWCAIETMDNKRYWLALDEEGNIQDTEVKPEKAFSGLMFYD